MTATVFTPQRRNAGRGVAPFLVGDVVKAVLARLLLPAAWNAREYVEGYRD